MSKVMQNNNQHFGAIVMEVQLELDLDIKYFLEFLYLRKRFKIRRSLRDKRRNNNLLL